ncbi:MAG: phosphotransferase [Rubrobacter sp.]|nr:phosphotransferase [Rubrobacter sp.]
MEGGFMSQTIPENIARNAVEMRGEAGEKWISSLPSLVSECEERWSLTAGSPFPNLSYNFAAPASRADGTIAVLKLSFPGEKEFRSEAEALKIFDGRGIARLLELDVESGAMLLERLEPGESLEATEDDEEATAIAAEVMRKLWRPAPPSHPFPTVAGWSKGFERLRASFDGGTGPMPTELVERAEKLFGELLASEENLVLLHGDLHHGNILSSGRGWLAIDPKGVVGERAYETAAMLHNPASLLEKENPGKLLERKIEILSERLGLEASRVRGWGFAQSVLAAYWSLEDHGEVWEEALAFARLMSKISG